jgi:uncharacterized protein (DUF885 family)
MAGPAARERVANRLARALLHGPRLRVVIAAIGVAVTFGVSAAADDAARLHAIFDDYWQSQMLDAPEFATFVGDDRYNDKLTDLAPEAIAKRKAAVSEFIVRLRGIAPTGLSDQDQVSRAVLLSQLTANERLQRFPIERMPVAGDYGPQLEFAYLIKSSPFRSVRDYENYIARLSALPLLLEQIEALMRQGLASNWVVPAAALEKLPAEFDPWVTDAVERSPAWRPFLAFPSGIDPSDRARLVDQARRVIAERITPAFKRLKTFATATYMRESNSPLGASKLPGGSAYYEALIAARTSTTMSAREIHELGLREVERIGIEMEQVMRETGFNGTRADFFKFLHDSPQFYMTRGDDVLVRYRDIAKRVDAELPKLFAELPRLPYGIRAMEAFEGDNAEHYTPGSAEAGRAGFFEANLNDLRTRPTFDMENVFLHEAVPGHHLQIARAQELRALPQFRRHAFFVAYTEGWALYAESLGSELGLYTEPYSRFGRLSWEMVRACRLVIDTGIHAFDWERSRAIDYMMNNTGLARQFAEAEIDRYTSNPGQALGYKVGELEIKVLRAKATAALGERFDVRRFHNALIDDGAVPLDVLDQRIDAWIEVEKRRVEGQSLPPTATH